MNPNSSFIEKTQSFLVNFRNWVFPPFCVSCKSLCTTQIFCPSCWDCCAPIDPEERCPHCFADHIGICGSCRKGPKLPCPHAYVFEKTLPSLYFATHFEESMPFFLLYQFAKLPWRMPDLIIPMPGAFQLAVAFAQLLNKPLARVLMEGIPWECDADAIEEGQVLLLIDVETPLEKRLEAIYALAEAFPQKIYILSVY